jgi:hypothetical protein
MEGHAMPFANLVGNKFFSLAFSWLLGQPVKDTLCGTKVLGRDAYRAIATNRSSFGDFDPFGDFDLPFGAAKLGLEIVELPFGTASGHMAQQTSSAGAMAGSCSRRACSLAGTSSLSALPDPVLVSDAPSECGTTPSEDRQTTSSLGGRPSRGLSWYSVRISSPRPGASPAWPEPHVSRSAIPRLLPAESGCPTHTKAVRASLSSGRRFRHPLRAQS